MMTKKLISNMKRKRKINFKDMLWGILWFGWVVVPMLYVDLARKSGRLT